MALLPARMQNSDPFPLRLGKKVVPQVATRPDPFREFEKGDGARLLSVPQQLDELMNGARDLMAPYRGDFVIQTQFAVQITGRRPAFGTDLSGPITGDALGTSKWSVGGPPQAVKQPEIPRTIGAICDAEYVHAKAKFNVSEPLTKAEIHEYYTSRALGRGASLPEDAVIERRASRLVLPLSERP